MKKARFELTYLALHGALYLPDDVKIESASYSPEYDCLNVVVSGDGLPADCDTNEGQPLRVATPWLRQELRGGVWVNIFDRWSV